MQVFDRWEEVERLFHAALEQEPAHRTEFLSKMCTDPELLAEVTSLLEAHEKGDSLLDRPPDKVAAEFLEEIDRGQDSLVGTSFDHYEITGVLGEGGMGRVYLAQDSRLARKVALKLLPAPHVQSLERLRRFAQEARVASALNHPNIITVYDYGSAFSSYYIATEYVEGRTLRSMIREGIDLRTCVEIAIQMASAFAAAHQAGIIHRDIKPENIMVRSDGLVKVLDFGLAKLSSRAGSMTTLSDSPATIPGAVMGTFCYMSPEQARGRELDARTDIFSFGIVMYEMATGRRPFEGDTLPDLLSSLVGSNPPALSAHVDGAPLELESILERSLARNLDERYQNFEDVLADLTLLRKNLELGTATPLPQRALPEIPAVRASQSEQRRARQTGPRGAIGSIERVVKGPQSRRLILLVIAVVVVIALAGWFSGIGKRIFHLNEAGTSSKKGPGLYPYRVSQPQRITDDGTASDKGVAVTRDGRLFAYLGRAGLSVFAMPASGQDTPTDVLHAACPDCKGPVFSPDGAYLYYVANESSRQLSSLYRRKIATNLEERIKEDVNRSVSFSPDGKKLVFVRNRYRALMLSAADGSGEQQLASLDGIGDLWLYPAWSPDGKIIACGVMNQNEQYQQVCAVTVNDASKKVVGTPRWGSVLNLAWMSDGSALIVNAADDRGRQPGLWQVSYPDGVVAKITNDLSGYFGAALTADSQTLLSVRGDKNASLYALDARNLEAVKKINLGLLNYCGLTGVCWAPDGKIICSAGPPEGKALYLVEPGGENRTEPRRLTSSAGINNSPCTAGSRYIVFTSDRSKHLSIWRMDINGENPIPLTPEGLNPVCSPDGESVVYQVATNQHTGLWRVSINGGAAEQLTDNDVDAENAAFSPDGQRIACLMRRGNERPQIAVISLQSKGQPPDYWNLPGDLRQPIIRWRDGQTIVYIDQRGEDSDIWVQSVEGLGRSLPPQRVYGARPHPLFNVIFNFDWARSGQIVLSAGDNSRDVVKLALTR